MSNVVTGCVHDVAPTTSCGETVPRSWRSKPRDNYNGDKRNVKLKIKNHSSTTIDIDVCQRLDFVGD
jgi:hypothetical protein